MIVENKLLLIYLILVLEKQNIMNDLFKGCNNLEKIVWPGDEKYSSIESISFMFFGCTKLIFVDFSNFIFKNTMKFDHLFSNCLNNFSKTA
jgi:hypothetical protein